MISNKDKVKEKVEEKGLKLGCWDNKLNELNASNLKKLFEGIKLIDTTDVDVNLNRKKYVVQISVVDGEIDFDMITKEEYIDRYGNERWEEE